LQGFPALAGVFDFRRPVRNAIIFGHFQVVFAKIRRFLRFINPVIPTF
jgi:hypothetical protein